MKALRQRLWRWVRHFLPQAPRAAGEGLRQACKPTLDEAADLAGKTLDQANRHARALLTDAEARAHRVAEDLEKRLEHQREQLLRGTEATYDRVSRRLARRLVIAGLVLLGAAGALALAVVWASRRL